MDHCQQINAKLDELKKILEEVKAILQWHKLRLFETKTNQSKKVFFQDDIARQFADKQADFWLLTADIHALLQDKFSAGRKYSRYKKEFAKLCMQFYYLGSDVRIY